MTVLAMAAMIASSPDLGISQGRCARPETGPSVLVEVQGLKDRTGHLRLELYPDDDADFLADDNVLISAGKTFARTDIATPQTGPVELCIRVPTPGRYALMLLHDRDGSQRFTAVSDGIGFPGNPRLGWSKPAASEAAVTVGRQPTRIAIILNYRHGLHMRPEGAS